MNAHNEHNELLDRYVKGQLSPEEAARVEARMGENPEFKRSVERHGELVATLKKLQGRNELREIMNDLHEDTIPVVQLSPPSRFRRLWPMIAMAASVGCISILATMFVMKSNDEAEYRALGRKVDQLNQSHQKMRKEIAETKKKISPSPGNFAGTGFLISSRGYVATSFHVVKDADSLIIENERFGSLKATVVHNDPLNDVSILKIQEAVSFPALPYTLIPSEASIAEDVYTLGFPREDIVFGEGSISATSGYRQNHNAYQISIPVNPGNSGGPLLNNKGNVIGMISGLQTQTHGTAFAIKSTVLLEVADAEVIDSLRVPLVLSKQNLLKNSNRVQQVATWRDFVFVVRVYKN
jgi:serine protease Do